MKKKNIDNISIDEINKQLKKLKDKEETCSFYAKLIFSTSISLSVIVTLMNPILALSHLLGVGVFSLGGLVSFGFLAKGTKCFEEIKKLEELRENTLEQLAMEDVLKEAYKPTLVKKTKTKKATKEHNNDLEL